MSSVESLPVAESILCNLEHVEVEVQLWSDSNRFDAGSNVLNVLEEHVKQSDFSLAIFSDDDDVISRGVSLKAPRDNVVLELGMFLGRLGKERAFYVLPKNVNVKVPTDFNGITPLKYSVNTSGQIDTRILVAGLKEKFSKLGVMKNI
ncbi:TIR domain-containing protein [Acinetobacter guillouiae]|uniref:TIR domain-containing protein n=1 Tax=Acinetobacter guillouiae TaxID=106649 RepID=UPI0032B4F775